MYFAHRTSMFRYLGLFTQSQCSATLGLFQQLAYLNNKSVYKAFLDNNPNSIKKTYLNIMPISIVVYLCYLLQRNCYVKHG